MRQPIYIQDIEGFQSERPPGWYYLTDPDQDFTLLHHNLPFSSPLLHRKLEPLSRKKQKPACCKPSSNLSVISIISLILLCPVFIQFREAWWKSSRFAPSIFNASLSLETVWQTPADWPVREEKRNSEPVIKRDIHANCANFKVFLNI